MSNFKNITLDAIADFEASLNPQKEEKKVVFNEKNYLNTRLDTEHGQGSKELIIRIIPFDSETNDPGKIIYTHSVKVPKEVSASGFKNYVCIEKTSEIDHEKFGEVCPFCERQKQLYKQAAQEGLPEEEVLRLKNEAKLLYPKTSCILRCIERGHEEDGPKFWKFNVRSGKDDAINQIMALRKTRMEESIAEGDEPLDILDVLNGKDLKIIITAEKDITGKYSNRTKINVMDYGKVKPLSTDEQQMERWINDTKKWSDVFVVKPYDYLSVILDGAVPFFNKNTNKWEPRGENSTEEPHEYTQNDIEEAESVIENVQSPAATRPEINDLPF